jgi:hypothetical protein
MGELEDIKQLLQSTLTAINTNLTIHQQMIMQLQEENKELKNIINKKQYPQNNLRENTNPLQKEILFKFKRNKKRLIKNKILETIKFKQLSIPEIKEIIVDQAKYCSKASFYRYIDELSRQDFIHIRNNTVKIKPLVEAI